ncbi:MAG: double-strand break repair protein AddB [Alphaproteobacteria bacterium]|nr:double-strand break repair protein AddB [Alphaproteobacteria bacterium]
MSISTLPPDLCFVRTLARGLYAQVKGDPLKLAAYTLYLPTRRAVRHLRDAFVQITDARAALLPQIRTLGDIDDEALDITQTLDQTIPPAIEPLRRQMLLMQLVMKKDEFLSFDQASAMSSTLGHLLDQMDHENLDPKALSRMTFPPESPSAYWQETLQFLDIIITNWPKILEQEGCISLIKRQRLIIESRIKQWEAKPPSSPIIAAGSTGSVPMIGILMAAIAKLDQGEVILPGLDLNLDDEAWNEIEETHPQYTMKKWLESAKVKRKDVSYWEGFTPQNPARLSLLNNASLPARVSERWQRLTTEVIPLKACEGLEILTLEHQRKEADVIALRLRAVLEEPDKTAALVTPNRALAARVAATLKRWNILVDDSAGTSLADSALGSFAINALAALAPQAGPLEALALLKHPLLTGPDDKTKMIAKAERLIWRGVRPASGWKNAALIARDKKEKALAQWLETLESHSKAFTENWTQSDSLETWIDRHIKLLENLGTPHLWHGDQAQSLSSLFDEWRQANKDVLPLTGADYLALFTSLIKQITLRPLYGQHPRLSLLGPLEARLWHHDLVILGGLNEGTWPPAPPTDPWMSRPMKQDLGLPTAERRIGQSAHDFIGLCAAPNVMITRASRVAGEQTVPSRLIMQINTILQVLTFQMPPSPWESWAQTLSVPSAKPQPIAPPSPCPPLALRPKELSVTEISTWMRNPYAIYARHILKLEKLDPFDAPVDAALRGVAIHKALETFIKKYGSSKKWPKNPYEALLEEGRAVFAPYARYPQIMGFWWPRFESMARWFVDMQAQRQKEGFTTLDVEHRDTLTLGDFTLKGYTDRLDRKADGTLCVIDYKTGSLPTDTQVMEGYEPQLALLSLMAQQRETPSEASYWQLQNKKIKSFNETLEAQMALAREGLEKLIETFNKETTPYEATPKASRAPHFNDYAHLARMVEWGREDS